MVVDCESLQSFGTRIDEPQTMSLSFLKDEFGKSSIRNACIFGGDYGTICIAFAVDQIVIGDWWRGPKLECTRRLCGLDNRVVVIIVPVVLSVL